MMVYVERHDLEKNMARFYRLVVQPTLFGEWAVISEVGPHRLTRPGARAVVCLGAGGASLAGCEA